MKNILLASAIVMGVSGCATILDGGAKTINMAPTSGSNVKAQVMTDAGMQNVTLPTVFSTSSSKEDIMVKITDECYEDTSYMVQSEINPVFFVNIFLGGVIGSTVDFATENMWTYDTAVTVPTNKKPGC